MKTKEKLFSLIETMRFPLSFLVVIAHMLPFQRSEIELSLDYTSLYIFISELFSHHIAKIPVPLFFIISGYFFYYNTNTFNWTSFIKNIQKRVKTLMIPYLSWNVIMLIAIMIVNYLKKMLFVDYQPFSFDWYNSFWGGPINFPLWYMRDLMVITLVSPILFFYLKHTRVFGLLILYILYLFIHEQILIGLSTTSIFYFSIGVYAAVNNINILEFNAKYKTQVYILSTILVLLATFNNHSIYHEYILRMFLIFGIISLFNIINDLSQNINIKNKLLKYSKSAFFIYVTHEIFIINWIKGFISKHEILSTGLGRIISYFIGPIICISICIFLFTIFNKYFPNTLNILTGMRAKSSSKIQ